MALKDENLRGLIVDREGAKQIQTQSGEIHTDWQKQRRKDENTAVAMARLQSLTPAEREQVRLDPSDWFSKFEDVNTKELIDYIQADESHRSRLATEQVNRMNAQEDLRWKEATQSGKHLDLYNRQLEIDVELAENSNTYRKDQIDALKEEREDIRYKREQAIEADKTTRAIDTGWQNKVADYMSGPQQAFDEKVKEIEQDSSLTEAEKVAKIMFGEEALAEMQALYEDGAPALSYLQEFKRNNADASQMGISNSEVATIVAGRREEAQNIRRINAEAEADIATRDTDYLKTAASGGDLSRFRFNEATNSVEILSPEDAKYNRLTLEEAENDILAKGKEDKALSFGTTGLLDWWGRDPGLTKNNQNLVKDLWNAVGKNRQLWNKLTDPVEYNIELGFLKDGDDRIENLPTSGQVMAVAQKLRDEASKQASDAQRPKYTAQEATDQLFGSWLNN